ncbi:MAG: putative selenium-dependent hydroxylase accessory protein YqeC [Candidatus Eremiobacteraeota bacterium]|nr:putative selenium-dependent hydroxylase accessory protein YqeC [Candidatus Eremiobacteraeota bacterium]
MREAANWHDAFDLTETEHIALVGGGGKTTTLWSLGRELAQRGPTIVTTTTKAGAPPADVALVEWDRPLPDRSLHELVADALQRSALVAVGSGVRDARLRAVTPEIADELFFRCGANYVVNEADGARMKPFKAPAEHEPVLASTTTLLVVVIGIDALDAPIDEEHVHRPERIADLTGAKLGDTLSAARIAAIVNEYEARCEDVDESARFAVLINKCDEGPQDARVSAITAALRDVELSSLVAASQREETRRWRVR